VVIAESDPEPLSECQCEVDVGFILAILHLGNILQKSRGFSVGGNYKEDGENSNCNRPFPAP
jgi:hypothetical protein